jgi:hypothetical protein
MSEQDPELQAFAKFIGAIEPWLDEAVLIGGWVTGCTVFIPSGENLDIFR